MLIKFENDMMNALKDFTQASLYVNDETYESITSDFKYFFGINECKWNDFLNELIIKLIEYSNEKKESIKIYGAYIINKQKNTYRSGKTIRFRRNAALKNTLEDTEIKNKTIYSDGEKKESIADLCIQTGDNGEAYFDDHSYISFLKKYFDLLLNEYGALPSHRREEIFFKQKYSVIEEAIKKHRILRINSGERKPFVRPYKLIADASVKYLYLTGYVGDKILSFRFSRITVLDNDSEDGSGELTINERKNIEQRIRESGIAYLAGKVSNDIEILLTDDGYDLFSNTIIYQRPDIAENAYGKKQIEMIEQTETEQLQESTGFKYTRRITFRCTERQAKNYFSRFGCDAVVVNPKELAEKCREFADKAARAYDGILGKQNKTARMD